MLPETAVAVAQKAETLPALNLELDVAKVKGELVPISEVTVTKDVTPEISKKVDALLADLLSIKSDDEEKKEQWKATIEQAGANIAKRSSARTTMLRRPLKEFKDKSEGGDGVAKSLIDLSMQVQELNPNDVSFNVGGFGKLVGMLPWVGSPVQRYFMKYETADNVIDGIMQSLNAGAETLKRNNVTLLADQKNLRGDTHKLREVIALLMLLDSRLEEKLKNDILTDDPRYGFLQEEILFPLKQVISDRQELLLACQQGVIAYEILIRNNKELVRGVRRANDVTLRALEIAVTIALGLYDQELVLKSLQKVNTVTSDLLAGTAARLRQTGVDVHKHASSASLDPEKLKQAFQDLNQALADISNYRREALPKMAAQIIEFDQMAAKSEESIKKLEAGNRARGTLKILDDADVIA